MPTHSPGGALSAPRTGQCRYRTVWAVSGPRYREHDVMNENEQSTERPIRGFDGDKYEREHGCGISFADLVQLSEPELAKWCARFAAGRRYLRVV